LILDFFSVVFTKAFIKQVLKYAIVGALGTVINLSILYLCTDILNIFYILSEIIAFFISVLPNFLINKIWTFRETMGEKIVIKYFEYVIVSLFSLGINLVSLFILVEYFNFWYLFGGIVAIFIGFIFSFIAHNLWTFRKRKYFKLNSE